MISRPVIFLLLVILLDPSDPTRLKFIYRSTLLQMVTISVFTLNCWGIGMGVSRDRVVRFTAIAQHLATSDYDIVCLQEVWCPEDYETIRKITRY